MFSSTEILDLIPIPVFAIGPDQKVLLWNTAMGEITGWPPETVIGTSRYMSLFSTKGNAEIGAMIREEREVILGTECLNGPDGSEIWVNITMRAIKHDGAYRGIVITLLDITEGQENEEKVRKYLDASIRDGLTKLFNSRLFRENLESEVQRASRYAINFTILILDLDNFKRINDTYGHLQGDAVLVRFADVIRASIRGSDVAYRYGGEEFAVILFGSGYKPALIVAERIRTNLAREIFLFEGKEERVTVSIGLAQYEKGDDATDIISKADGNLYQAKNTGKNKVVSSHPIP